MCVCVCVCVCLSVCVDVCRHVCWYVHCAFCFLFLHVSMNIPESKRDPVLRLLSFRKKKLCQTDSYHCLEILRSNQNCAA